MSDIDTRLSLADIAELAPATCPQCRKDKKGTFLRRGGRLICRSCWEAEKAKDAACTCTTFGHCEVCR